MSGVERLHATLVGLIDDRLMAKHRVDRHTDPDAAKAILGDDLTRFANDPATASSLTRVATLERLVTLIEQI